MIAKPFANSSITKTDPGGAAIALGVSFTQKWVKLTAELSGLGEHHLPLPAGTTKQRFMDLQSVLAITVAGTGLLIGTGVLKPPKIGASVYPHPFYEHAAPLQSSPSYQPLGSTASAADEIEVSLANRTVSVYKNGNRVRTYPIGIGSPSTPTPKGVFSVLEKEVNPVYFNSEGRKIPLGSRWIAFLQEGDDVWGLHGGDLNTESLGCIHMLEPDLQELYEMVPIGTKVSIR